LPGRMPAREVDALRLRRPASGGAEARRARVTTWMRRPTSCRTVAGATNGSALDLGDGVNLGCRGADRNRL
jgi:hypothetical protein